MNSAFTQGILQAPLTVALGGTGLSSLGTALQVLRVNAGGTALEYGTIGVISDGDKGDITVASSGTVWTIDNDAVTYAKMQNVSAASKLLGRGSAGGSGDVEEITLGTGLSMSGTTLSVTGGTGDVVGPASSTDTAVAIYDGTTGKLIKDSTLLYSALGALTGLTQIQPTSSILAGTTTSTSTTAAAGLLFGASTAQYQISNGGITQTITANNNFNAVLIRQCTLTEAASGTHPLISSVAVRSPIINNGSATTTNGVTVYIEGAPTGTASPTNVYAVWVDDGVVRIDGTIELGDASDTTLSRSAAGVLAVEGVAVPTISSTSTLTNKRIDPRVVSATSYTTSTTIDSDVTDMYVITAQAGALLFNNPSGTPVQGQKLIIRIKDNGTARVLTYGSEFRGISQTLPSTTVISKTLYMGFIRNSTDTKWDLIAVAQEV